MAKVKEIARYVRSKNAGPFWVTVEIFCEDDAAYNRIKNAKNINEELISKLYHVDAALVKKFYCDSIFVVKFSYPRPHPSGWKNENDMHAGQQYVFLSEVEVEE